MTSTNKLPLADLKLAYGITVSIVNRAYDSSVQRVEQFSSIQEKRYSRFLWLLVGSVIIGSFIWLMQLIPLEGWSIQLAGFSTAVLALLLTPVFLRRKRIAQAQAKSVTSSGELAFDVPIESIKRLQKQSQVLMALTQAQTLNRGNFQAIIEQITASAADALEVERVSVWLYNKDRSQMECVEVYDPHTGSHWSGSASPQEKTQAQVTLHTLHHPITPEERPASPTRPLTPSPHHLKPVAIANRLDAPIWLNEQIVGVVCYEHLAPTAPSWTPQDENFASAIASFVAIALEVNALLTPKENCQSSYPVSVNVSELGIRDRSPTVSPELPIGSLVAASSGATTPLAERDTLKSGVVEEIVALSRDITQPKWIEEALRASERQFQKLTANVPGIIFECLLRTDGSMSFLFVSRGVREICKLEPRDIQQNPEVLINLIHTDDRLRLDILLFHLRFFGHVK